MARPLRIEFPGAVYHVTSRGDRREAVFADDMDRVQFLGVLENALSRFHARALAWCLMGNHYHLVLRTERANLSLLMRQINGVYTQAFNRRHGLVGHLFQGRFKAILVDAEANLLRLCPYVELNPVRARLVKRVEDWPWSSYRAHVGLAEAPSWLDQEGVAGQLLQIEDAAPTTPRQRRTAARRYAALVAQAAVDADEALWRDGLRQQIYLGDADFVLRMQSHLPQRTQAAASRARDVPKPQRVKPLTLAQWLKAMPTREDALRAAHVESGISMTALAQQMGLTVGRVSQLVKKAEERSRSGEA